MPEQKTNLSGMILHLKLQYFYFMADRLYLSVWFPSFQEEEILPRVQSVLKQFPFSTEQPGVKYLAVRSISWEQPIVFQQTFDDRVEPEQAIALAGEFLHEDNAYEIDVMWDLWVPVQEGDLDETWTMKPQTVKLMALGTAFDEAAFQEDGHIQIDFGLDAPFLFEEADYNDFLEQRIKANVQKLVAFTNAIEESCSISGRVLWSESEDNLAQKLIERLQKIQ